MKSENLAETKLFDDFSKVAAAKNTTPVAVYFYWPADDTTDTPEVKDQIAKCKTMDAVLSSAEVSTELAKFACYKVNLKNLDKAIQEKYQVTAAPKVVFYLATGEKGWEMINADAKPENVAKSLREVAESSAKKIEEMKNAEQPKEEPKK